MIIQQFFIKGIAHSSYLLGGTKTCAIIDPQRDVDIYMEAANSLGLKIKHIFETHLHADFVSGHIEFAKKTDVKIYAPESGKCRFEHVALAEGDLIEIEDMVINVLETPGHTPEHMSYVITDRSRGDDPVGVFCGDTLFVGDVGRPDLFPGKAKELASNLYDSLHEKLLKLPDFCEVYPAHGAGSLCGRAMGAKRTSTIGYERKYNAALLIKDRDEFIKSLTTNMPPAPDHFSRCSDINRKGPNLLRHLPVLEEIEPANFNNLYKKTDSIVLDIRSYEAFGGQHVPGAYHIDMRGNFATFAGWILPQDKNILLVSDTPEQAQTAAVWLRRVGLDQVTGCLKGSMYTWANAGFPTDHVIQVSATELYNMTSSKQKMAIIDVRTSSEYESFHINGAIHIPATDLRQRYKELDPGIPTVVICGSGQRSSMGCSILRQHGFKQLYNTAGGMSGYSAAGYPR